MTPTRTYAAAALLSLVALSACGTSAPTSSAPSTPAPTTAVATPTPSASSPSASKESASASTTPVPTAGAYIDYATWRDAPEKYADGKVVLFFHADWCPKCRETDENLASDPASLPPGLTVVKADFDAENALRQQYGVTVQHTFVQVDADGGEVAVWTGTYTGADIAGKTV